MGDFTTAIPRGTNQGVNVGVNFFVEVFDAESGKLLERHERHNLVVNTGLTLLRDLLFGDTVAVPSHFALGTSAVAPAAGDTTLAGEVLRDVFTAKVKGTNKIVVQYYLNSVTGNGNTFRSAAIFNANAGGTMYAGSLLGTPIAKTTAVAVAFTWELSVAAV